MLNMVLASLAALSRHPLYMLVPEARVLSERSRLNIFKRGPARALRLNDASPAGGVHAGPLG